MTYPAILKSTLFLILIFTIGTSCDEKRPLNFNAEPADPDTWDLTVWDKVETGTHSGFGTLDISYPRSIPPEGEITEAFVLRGWKGERVNCKLLVWTSGAEEEVSIEVKDFKNKSSAISKDYVTTSVIKYTLTNQFLNENGGSCGPRDNDELPAHLSPDIIEECDLFTADPQSTRPVWISVDIPADATPGTYDGTIIRKSTSGKVKHPVKLVVQDQTLPPPSEWPFHLDLWQNPYAVARFHNVELWSDKHIELLRPYLTMLADAGQKCITAIIIDRPWGFEKPCYDDHREMIKWTKKKDGTWEYDYSIFDKYVSLAMECGIKKQITCYTLVPIRNEFTWHDEASSEVIVEELFPGTKDYEDHIKPFLADFREHLRKKGWLDITTIGLDERGEEEMAKMFDFMDEVAPDFKIAVAGFYHGSINSRIYDFCSNWRDWGRIPVDSIPVRKENGLITTYYVACGIEKPNTFTFSPPAESCYLGWMASSMGFDGFLRWAYNSWPENPLVDSRYTKWPPGDTYFIYPGPLTSVRFERLREGIQDYEKIRILREALASESSGDANAKLTKLEDFLSTIDAGTIDEKTAAEVLREGKRVLAESSE